MAVVITNIDPTTLKAQTYSPQDISLIPAADVSSNFVPSANYIEYSIISSNGSFQVTEYDFTDFKIINDTSPAGSALVYNVDLNPENDLKTRGFNNGD